MRDIKIKLYKFEELKPEVQEQVIEDNRYINVDFTNWNDTRLNEWKSQLKDMGFINVNIEYSGFYSQGDGASFTGRINNQESLIKLMEEIDKKKYKPLRFAMRRGEVELTAWIKSINRQYSHERTKSLELDLTDMTYNMNPKRIDTLTDLANDLETELEEKRLELSKEIYQDLKDDYESFTSDESVKETLIINEYQFLEGGEQFYTE